MSILEKIIIDKKKRLKMIKFNFNYELKKKLKKSYFLNLEYENKNTPAIMLK